jgi:hypothetical protein
MDLLIHVLVENGAVAIEEITARDENGDENRGGRGHC